MLFTTMNPDGGRLDPSWWRMNLSMVIVSFIITAEWAWYNSEMGIGRGASHWVRRDAPPAYPARAPDPTSKGSFICDLGIGRCASHWVPVRRDAPPECIGPYVARATDPTSKSLCVRAGEPIVSSSSNHACGGSDFKVRKRAGGRENAIKQKRGMEGWLITKPRLHS